MAAIWAGSDFPAEGLLEVAGFDEPGLDEGAFELEEPDGFPLNWLTMEAIWAGSGFFPADSLGEVEGFDEPGLDEGAFELGEPDGFPLNWLTMAAT